MYLIKNIIFNGLENALVAENGILVNDFGSSVVVENGIKKVEKKLVVIDEYWGKTDICLGASVDKSKLLSTGNKNSFLLSYVSIWNKNCVKDIGKGFKGIRLFANGYNEHKIQGYIVFIKRSLTDIKTNGQKIFGRYPNEIVVVLKEGQYLEFDNKKIQVVNKQFVQLT